jgi:hypothetical protein
MTCGGAQTPVCAGMHGGAGVVGVAAAPSLPQHVRVASVLRPMLCAQRLRARAHTHTHTHTQTTPRRQRARRPFPLLLSAAR